MATPIERPELADMIDQVLDARGAVGQVINVREHTGGERIVSIDGDYTAGDLRAIANVLEPIQQHWIDRWFRPHHR